MDRAFADHGFLPNQNPLKEFPRSSPLAVLDEIGHDLPSLLQDPGFRERARRLVIPPWTEPENPTLRLPQLRLYYVRLGFLAVGVHQPGRASRPWHACRGILRCRCATSAGGSRGRRS